MRAREVKVGDIVRIKEDLNIQNRIGNFPNLSPGDIGTITSVPNIWYRDSNVVVVDFPSYGGPLSVFMVDLQIKKGA